jgi:hypothetical protein
VKTKAPYVPLDGLLSNLSVDTLPAPDTKRWVIRRKATVVAALRLGMLTIEEACHRYRLSIQEIQSWQNLVDRHGLRGLRVTRLQDYRISDAQPSKPSASTPFNN